MQVAAESPQTVPGMLTAARRPIVVQKAAPCGQTATLADTAADCPHPLHLLIYRTSGNDAMRQHLAVLRRIRRIYPLASACCGRANQISLYNLHY